MKNFKGIIFAIISSGTFGLIPLFALPLMNEYGMSNSNILFYRFLFSALIMGVICAIRKQSFRITKKDVTSLFGLGILYALTALFLIYSYLYIPSGVATTIHFLYPICVSFLMVVFFKEQKSNSLLLAALLSLVGVSLMCWSAEGGIMLKGVLIAAVTILTYGVYIVGLNKSSIGRLNAEMLTFYVLLAGCVVFLGFALVTDGLQPIPSVGAGVNIVMLALLATVISDLTLILAVKYAGSTVTAILGSMEPVVAVMVGVFVFHEYFGLKSFVGITLIIGSVILVILADKKNKKKLREAALLEANDKSTLDV